MVDEILDRHYQAERQNLNAALADGFRSFAKAVRNAFEVLVKIEYQAPWAVKSRQARCN